jgi:hypothetical protein
MYSPVSSFFLHAFAPLAGRFHVFCRKSLRHSPTATPHLDQALLA